MKKPKPKIINNKLSLVPILFTISSIVLFVIIVIGIVYSQVSPQTTTQASVQNEKVVLSISEGDDDAEEKVMSGQLVRSNEDLDMTFDRSDKTESLTGLRFQNVTIPQGATITNAFIEFVSNEKSSEASNIIIVGENASNSQPFSSKSKISTRQTTTASTNWNPEPWLSENTVYNTSDISPVIAEIIRNSDWKAGNALTLIIKGSGQRVAHSYNQDNGKSAPKLHIAYSVSTGPTTQPTVQPSTSPQPTVTTAPSVSPSTSPAVSPTTKPNPTTQPTVQPSTSPQPTPSPTMGQLPPAGGTGMWISKDRLASLPTTGAAWNYVVSQANYIKPELRNQDDQANLAAMASALVYARTNDRTKLDNVLNAIRVVTYDNTDSGARSLAIGRETASYVIAADLINLPALDAKLNQDFKNKLKQLRDNVYDDRSIISTHNDRPNNWGTMAGGTRIAIDLYLGDKADLDAAAKVFRGYVGDRSAYAGFDFRDTYWQCDPQNPVGINPAGCKRYGWDLGGAVPDDLRRNASQSWPPPCENYVRGALQGAITQAILLDQAGYTINGQRVWDWQDRALLRAAEWFHTKPANCYFEGDDEWLAPAFNYYYGSSFPASATARGGNTVGFTGWTHAK